MPSPPVHHVDVRAFRYATEVPARVEAALSAVYPGLGDPEEPAIDRTTTEGHYGHEIDIYEAHLETTDQLRTVFDRLRDGGDLGRVHDELGDRVTQDNELFLRLDKQTAYTEGVLRLGTGIELRAKIEAYPAKRETAIENLDGYLSALREDG